MNRTLHDELPILLELARDHSDSGRIKLAQHLADVFFAPESELTAREEELVEQFIRDILNNAGEITRREFVKRFADAAGAPRHVALKVAKAPIEVARPVLIGNEYLTDEDLVAIVEAKDSDYATAIASRQAVNEVVADALVATGDLRVMQIVAENLGAKLSARALEVLVDSARLTSLLQKPILTRPELTPECATRLYWWVAQDLRQETLVRYGFGPGKLEKALDKAVEEILSTVLLQKEDDVSMYQIANWLEERGALNTKILPRLLRMGHYRLFNIALSRLSQLDLSLVDKINSVAGSRMMVVLCRAIDVDKGNFVSIFLMSRGARKDEQIVHPRELSQAIEAFDKLQPDMAKMIIESWRVDPSTLFSRLNEPWAANS
ncbi:MAG: DUF2336 domain-containing protein [Alphaproteobacteria bacterium]|nr:DUF2336 domain-containing protein [Alphaproteobacteria bacterium]